MLCDVMCDLELVAEGHRRFVLMSVFVGVVGVRSVVCQMRLFYTGSSQPALLAPHDRNFIPLEFF